MEAEGEEDVFGEQGEKDWNMPPAGDESAAGEWLCITASIDCSAASLPSEVAVILWRGFRDSVSGSWELMASQKSQFCEKMGIHTKVFESGRSRERYHLPVCMHWYGSMSSIAEAVRADSSAKSCPSALRALAHT